MANNRTIFQTLSRVVGGGSGSISPKQVPIQRTVNTYNINPSNDILFSTQNKEEFEQKKLQAQQQKLLAMQWYKAGIDLAASSNESLTNIQLMYRDADLMEVSTPEIGTALEIVAEETCMIGNSGKMLNITSKSDRIKAILEDLFYNRLDLHVVLPMVVKDTAKYGNEFMMLNINGEDGVTGWRRLPVYEMQRLENGITNPYMAVGSLTQVGEVKPDETKFLWVGKNVSMPYQNWQVAHFRLMNDSTFLPYGCSWLHKARRSWRMLTMMEDMMLIYRLERSIERRVFKIYTGAIDDNDVPAYMQQVANQFKRTPIIDPQTGQIDLRKNFAPVWRKTPIPLLDGRTITIEELAKEYDNGKTNYVYSIQDKTGKIVPGKVVWCGKNYTANKMIKITLDDGGFMSMAPEHEVVMRDGSKKRADQLLCGESVMPFYREIDSENAGTTKRKMTVSFDDFIWEEIREAIIKKIVYNRTTLLEYINTFLIEHLLEINTNRRLHRLNKISRGVLEARIREKGFNTITEYINAIKKNHKITKIEVIDGDDVYCMTVVGLNGEDDRHNFALRTISDDGSWNESGCFVRNSVDSDFFIPFRTEDTASKIETLPSAQNPTSMEDIEYVRQHLLAALRVPKAFLNFTDPSQGKGQNLSIMDVRFSRMINRVQQSILMELNKIAIIHLLLLGFTDEITNFTLTMNNPSSQVEMQELDALTKRVQTAQTLLADPGNGIQIYSYHRVLKEILHMSDTEIADNLNEIRLEKALAAELQNTQQIIKKTGIFDPTDRIYGDPEAKYDFSQQEEGGEGGPGGGGPMGGGPDIGGGLDALGGPGEDSDVGGEEETMDMGAAPEADAGGTLSESKARDRNLIREIYTKKPSKKYFDEYMKILTEEKRIEDTTLGRVETYSKNFIINEELNSVVAELDEIIASGGVGDTLNVGDGNGVLTD